jgi:hypothetical protein
MVQRELLERQGPLLRPLNRSSAAHHLPTIPPTTPTGYSHDPCHLHRLFLGGMAAQSLRRLLLSKAPLRSSTNPCRASTLPLPLLWEWMQRHGAYSRRQGRENSTRRAVEGGVLGAEGNGPRSF